MNNRKQTVALGLGAALFFWGSAAGAQKAELADEVEIIRSEVDIARPHPVPPTIESVLVFTNRGIVPRRVHCVAWNKNGAVVGRVRTLVPLKGVRYLLASDFGASFLGSARCTSAGHVEGTAFLLAPGLTNLPTQTGRLDQLLWIRFDLLAYRP